MVDLVLKLLLKYIWEILFVACLIGCVSLVYWKANTWCNLACRELKEENEAYRLKVVELNDVIAVAEKRATDLALMWSNSLERTEKKYAEEYQAALELFRNLDKKGKASASRTPTLRITPAVNSVLVSASAAANSPSTPAPRSGEEGTSTVPAAPEGNGDSQGTVISEADFTASWIEAARAYASCKTAWSACVTSYESVREASGRITQNVQDK